jgi:hypothetical protein
VTVVSDSGGIEAGLFGAEASGATLLFDAQGGLLFSGGITASRGHAGENAGENAVVSLINGERAPLSRTFVFGCSFRAREQKGNQAPCPR